MEKILKDELIANLEHALSLLKKIEASKKTSIGARLKEAREATGETQSSFARRVGVDPISISRTERNVVKNGISKPLQKAIQQKTCINLEYVLHGKGEPLIETASEIEAQTREEKELFLNRTNIPIDFDLEKHEIEFLLKFDSSFFSVGQVEQLIREYRRRSRKVPSE